MDFKPIFVATHPRSCSTAFERVFMTRDDLACVHEPFGDAFYYGPERLSPRFEGDEKTRLKSGFSESSFKTILDDLEAKRAEGKRLIIKDMAYYICYPEEATCSIAPSLARVKRGVGTENGHSNGVSDGVKTHINGTQSVDEPENPTVLPLETLKEFHFTFLIRHPRSSIPSYFRCTRPPLDKMTGFYDFLPCEAGYAELRRLFDFLRSLGHVGPKVSSKYTGGHKSNGIQTSDHHMNGHMTNGHLIPNGSFKDVEICVIDADDLLDHPDEVVSAFCKSVGLDFQESMLKWDSEKDQKQAREAFEKWRGFHEDATHSSGLKPRAHRKHPKSEEEENAEWREKFGEKGAQVIRETVNANVADFEYLKQFAMQV